MFLCHRLARALAQLTLFSVALACLLIVVYSVLRSNTMEAITTPVHYDHLQRGPSEEANPATSQRAYAKPTLRAAQASRPAYTGHSLDDASA